MSSTRPINPDHAISEVNFVLQFARMHDENSISKILQVEEQIKKVLPKVEYLKTLGIEISDDVVTKKTFSNVPTGIVFRKFSKEGAVELSLHADQNFIAMKCLKYDRWTSVWKRVRPLLELAAKNVIDIENPVVAVTLHYIDTFTYTGEIGYYSYKDVFREDSEFLSDRVKKSGPFWHIFQGWFDDLGTESGIRILHTLKVNVAGSGSTHKTVIDHQITKQYITPLGISKDFIDESAEGINELDRIFNDHHDKNKEVLKKLLSDPMQKAIKLLEE